MHVVIFVGIGLVALVVFYFGAKLLGKSGLQGAYVFPFFWFVASVCNGLFGMFRAGIPLINEVAAFVPIFGIPAGCAWYLLFKYGAR